MQNFCTHRDEALEQGKIEQIYCYLNKTDLYHVDSLEMFSYCLQRLGRHHHTKMVLRFSEKRLTCLAWNFYNKGNTIV